MRRLTVVLLRAPPPNHVRATLGPHPITAPREILGYHGCSREAASRITTDAKWRPSENRYDWLGAGIYFWEYAPYRALEWATERYGTEAAVVGVRIQLGRCLNLLDRQHFEALKAVYEETLKAWLASGMRPLVNTQRGAHFLDRHIIDEYCSRVMARDARLAFQTVRGSFAEGSPLFPGSKLLTKSHLQVSVRDPRCIVENALVTFPR